MTTKFLPLIISQQIVPPPGRWLVLYLNDVLILFLVLFVAVFFRENDAFPSVHIKEFQLLISLMCRGDFAQKSAGESMLPVLITARSRLWRRVTNLLTQGVSFLIFDFLIP